MFYDCFIAGGCYVAVCLALIVCVCVIINSVG